MAALRLLCMPANNRPDVVGLMQDIPKPIRVNAIPAGFQTDGPPLAQSLSALPATAPVVIMVHGYRFAPGIARHCPHRHILALDPDPADHTAISWPRHLGLSGAGGIAVGFGWQSRGILRRVHQRATAAGQSLAALIAAIPASHEVHVIAHSLGARVALASLPHLPAGRVGRMVLLAGAETRGPARAAMNTPAGATAQVFNITTRENDLFDVLLEWLAMGGCDTAIGEGLGQPLSNWLDLQIDQTATTEALARLGHRLPAARSRISHWSPYMRPGLLPMYRALLTGELPLTTLRAALPSARDPRWSRLVPHWPLPLRPNPA